MPFEPDTIVAISTAPGRGGIGVVRLSGPLALEAVAPMLRLRRPLAAGQVRFAQLLDDAGEVLDEALVTFFAAPRSYTAEDVVEVSCHGSPVLLDAVVRGCLARGARLAEPGEFTQRGFLAGRLDLTQAEAVNDLIAAQTIHQARTAAAQLGGSVARTIAPIKQRLVALIAELEAGIDFAEDDLELMPQERIVAAIARIRGELERLAATYWRGRVVREGFTLAIVGRPNAGKSSLFNRLLERERAIVTAQPGTTRDPVSERLAIAGIPVELIDTAGLRAEPEGEAERQGIERSRAALADADFVVLVVDAACGLEGEDRETLAGLEGRAHALVLNKSDLVGLAGVREGEKQTPFGIPFGNDNEGASKHGGMFVSAKTGEGIEELKAAILTTLLGATASADTALVTNLRQHEAVAAAAAAMQKAGVAAEGELPHEMLLLDLYAGLEGLDRLTGATTSEDVLGLIFSRFCIGK